MMNSPIDILKTFWGHEGFRGIQEEIITHVVSGTNTIYFLPVPENPSVFQVPAMCQPGLCIVISPLVALMEDQVQSLRDTGHRTDRSYFRYQT